MGSGAGLQAVDRCCRSKLRDRENEHRKGGRPTFSEGVLYGTPLPHPPKVMNYAVMQEFAVDANSGQFKAPFNEIKNERHVATPEDTAVITPNSDTPYSICWLDLRAEPMVVSVPAVEKERYYAVQLIDGNTYNYGYIGSRATGPAAGDYLIVGPEWKGEKPAGIKQVFSSTTPFALTLFRTQLFNADDMPGVEKVQAGYKVQPLSAFTNNPRRLPQRRSISSRPARQGSKRTSTSISTPRSSSSPSRRPTRKSAPNWRPSASGPARLSTSRISRWNTRPLFCSG